MTVPKDVALLAAIFTASGVTHLVRPEVFEPLVPGLASTAVLLGVYPGNLKMAVDASRTRSTKFKAIAYGRLPLHLPMIRIAWRAGW